MTNLIFLDGLFSIENQINEVMFEQCTFSENIGLKANTIYLSNQPVQSLTFFNSTFYGTF